MSLAEEGVRLFRASRYLESELRLRESLYLYPSADPVRMNLAATLEAQGLTDEALAIYKGYLAKNPRSLVLLQHIARAFVAGSDYPAAISAYTQIAEQALERADPGTAAQALRSLASLHFRVGEEENALCRSAEALAVKNDVEETLKHAKLLLASAQYARAEELLVATIGTFQVPAHPEILRELAVASFGAQKFDQAIKYAENALDTRAVPPEKEAEVQLIINASHLMKGDTLDEEEELARVPVGQDRLFWPVLLVEGAEQVAALEGAE